MSEAPEPGESRSTVAGVDLERLSDDGELARALVDGLPGAGLLVVDAALRVRMARGDVHRRLGIETAVGRPLAELMPEPAWQALAPRYARALDGEVQLFEFVTPAGRTHRVRLAPLREDDADAVTGLVVLSQDVTDERRLEQGAQAQRAVLEAVDEGVVVFDRTGELLVSNPAADAILGRSLGDHPSDWWTAIRTRAGDDGGPLDVGGEVLRTGVPRHGVEADVERPDGTVVAVTLNYVPLPDAAGTPVGLAVAFRDVTLTARAHHELRESRERLREAHHVAGLASWELDLPTGQVTVHHALTGDLAASGSRAPVSELLAVLPPAGRARAQATLDALAGGGRTSVVERYACLLGGLPACLEMRARAERDDEGRVVRIRGTTQDVTDEELARRDVAATRDFLQATLDSLPAHVVVLDEHGDILMTNRAWNRFAERAGAGAGAAVTGNYLAACDAAVGDEHAARAGQGLRAVIAGETDRFCLEYPCPGPDGEQWFQLQAARFEGAGSARAVVSHEDVTARRAAEVEVRRQAMLLDEVDAAVVATDARGIVTHWNHAAERLYGWTRDEAVGRRGAEVVVPADTERARAVMGALRRTGAWEGELDVRRKDGTVFPAYVRDRVLHDDEGNLTALIGVAIDISARVAVEQELRSARTYLTTVTDSVAEGLFTLDAEGRATYVNRAAERMLGWSREQLVGRVLHDVVHFRRPDGSPFPVEECPIVRARRDGEPVRVEDDEFVRADGRHLPVAYTAAPFLTPDGTEGCVVVFEDVTARRARQQELERDAEKLAWIRRLQTALSEDHFTLYAQPIVELAGGTVVQRELLLRLRNPDGSVEAPGAFLPIAEEYGLIRDIDAWVIRRAVDLAAAGGPVELNVSARSIGDPAFCEHIERRLVASGAEASDVVLELTETALVDDEQAAIRFAERLHVLGCKLALDDFGTGYGGLAYLKRLPVDVLKIDMEFVRDLTRDPASRHVVEAVVALARSFGLHTVAEGVEDGPTLDLLRELGVDMAQGYFIARPAPVEEAAGPTPSSSRA